MNYISNALFEMNEIFSKFENVSEENKILYKKYFDKIIPYVRDFHESNLPEDAKLSINAIHNLYAQLLNNKN